MTYVAGQLRSRGEGKYIAAEWEAEAVRLSRPAPPMPGSVIERLKNMGAFEVVS